MLLYSPHLSALGTRTVVYSHKGASPERFSSVTHMEVATLL